MEITKKRQFNDIALGFYLLSHPVPVMFHILAVTVFTLLAAWPHFAWSIIALVIAAHAAMQIPIAMLNDYCDRRLDAASKPGKPIPRDRKSTRLNSSHQIISYPVFSLKKKTKSIPHHTSPSTH